MSVKPIIQPKIAYEMCNNCRQALSLASKEQKLEDFNSHQRSIGSLHRKMICLPLTDVFDPPPGQQGHGKLQVSDRVSIPKELMSGVFLRKPEPPWQFVIRKLPNKVVEEEGDDEDKEGEDEDGDDNVVKNENGGAENEQNENEQDTYPLKSLGTKGTTKDQNKKHLDYLYCHVLDSSAPRNYIFVPRWMMKTLDIRPRDEVSITWTKLKEGNAITLKPLNEDFYQWHNPQAVMESELKYYSSLTLGSIIAIAYRGAQHHLKVVKIINGEDQLDGANIQDVNIAVDFEGNPESKKVKELY